MYLIGLLAVPLIIGIIATAIGKGRLTWKELFVQEGILLVAISAVYGISLVITRYGASMDTEIWNGRIAEKDHGSEHCCHSYPCNCRPCNCDKSGCHSTCCDTCYRHSHDIWWNATATTGETVYSDGCNSPGTNTPRRWTEIKIGEPTAVEHSYENYIKANPDTLFKRTGAAQAFPALLPAYPETYDYYRVKRVLALGVPLSRQLQTDLDNQLDEINAKLGASKQMNITLVLAATADQKYVEALNDHWLGGKKNDLVVAIGIKTFPVMDWAGVVSLTKSEDMKLAIRDKIMYLKSFDGPKVLKIIEGEARHFKRREMRDFEYLMDSVEPPVWVLILIFILGTAGSVLLSRYFILNDPFGAEGRGWDRRKRFRRFY